MSAGQVAHRISFQVAALSGACCRSEPGTAGGPARTAPINMTPRGCIFRPAWAERIRRGDWHAGRQGMKPGCSGTASGASIQTVRPHFLRPCQSPRSTVHPEARMWPSDALRAVPSNGSPLGAGGPPTRARVTLSLHHASRQYTLPDARPYSICSGPALQQGCPGSQALDLVGEKKTLAELPRATDELLILPARPSPQQVQQQTVPGPQRPTFRPLCPRTWTPVVRPNSARPLRPAMFATAHSAHT
jgi:hypothetical protein